MSEDALFFINVRFAGEARCSTDFADPTRQAVVILFLHANDCPYLRVGPGEGSR